MLNQTATSPELYTRADFSVEAPDSGYYYPFSHEHMDFRQAPDDAWPDRLPEEDQGPDGVYVKPGFNLEKEIDGLSGPIVEIGGPTKMGFNFLNDVRLPSRPFMTDIVGSDPDKRGFSSLVAVDKLVLDALLDVRKLPIADNSVGMVLTSCLPKIDQHTIRETNNDSTPTEEEEENLVSKMIDNEYAAAEEYRAGQRMADFAEVTGSPRIAAVIQAARILQLGGLFIARRNNTNDAAIAKAAGLDLVMHTPMEQKDEADRHLEFVEEMVFQKPFEQPSDR